MGGPDGNSICCAKNECEKSGESFHNSLVAVLRNLWGQQINGNVGWMRRTLQLKQWFGLFVTRAIRDNSLQTEFNLVWKRLPVPICDVLEIHVSARVIAQNRTAMKFDIGFRVWNTEVFIYLVEILDYFFCAAALRGYIFYDSSLQSNVQLNNLPFHYVNARIHHINTVFDAWQRTVPNALIIWWPARLPLLYEKSKQPKCFVFRVYFLLVASASFRSLFMCPPPRWARSRNVYMPPIARFLAGLHARWNRYSIRRSGSVEERNNERKNRREEWKRLSIVRVNRSECIIKEHRSLPLHFNRDHHIFYVNFSSLRLPSNFFRPEISNFSLMRGRVADDDSGSHADIAVHALSLVVVRSGSATPPPPLPRALADPLLLSLECTDPYSTIITSEMFICALPFYAFCIRFDQKFTSQTSVLVNMKCLNCEAHTVWMSSFSVCVVLCVNYNIHIEMSDRGRFAFVFLRLFLSMFLAASAQLRIINNTVLNSCLVGRIEHWNEPSNTEYSPLELADLDKCARDFSSNFMISCILSSSFLFYSIRSFFTSFCHSVCVQRSGGAFVYSFNSVGSGPLFAGTKMMMFIGCLCFYCGRFCFCRLRSAVCCSFARVAVAFSFAHFNIQCLPLIYFMDG